MVEVFEAKVRACVRLLVTGAAGYIGSLVAHESVAAGHEVIAFDSLVAGRRAAVPPEARFEQLDIRDGEALSALCAETKPEAVVHLAAFTALPLSLGDPGLCFDTNVGGGLNLLRAMVENDVRLLVFSSTAAVYGEPETVPIPESHPTTPINAYGESKIAFERMLPWFHAAHGLRSVSFRYFNVAGALPELGVGDTTANEARLVAQILNAAAGEIPALEVFGGDYPTADGSCVRDYVHVQDVADAHLMALDWLADNDACEAFNLGSGVGHSVLEMVAAAEDAIDLPINKTVVDRRPGDPAVLAADITAVGERLGWAPAHSALDEIIASAWEWKRRYPGGDGSGAG